MRLLIVDDEPMIRLGLEKMAGFYTPAFKEIRTAGNGLDALGQIRESEPNIVLTDIRMAKMDGLDLCRSIHDQFPRIQTVVISGYNDFEYAQKCLEYGVKHYLLKPVAKSDVFEVLDNLIKKPVRGYMPVSRYVDWIDRMEQCIWSIQEDELGQLLQEWREYCLSASASPAQLKELLGDCLTLLGKRFQVRGYSSNISVSDIADGSVREALDQFEERIRQTAVRLITVRKGLFKDPMDESRTFIDSHLSEDISLEQVAGMVGLTPTYFSALFKKVTGETFVQYRINRRMEKARELLAVPHVRIVDVASMVGYEDYPHFTKTFKKIVGVSPSDYRSVLGIK